MSVRTGQAGGLRFLHQRSPQTGRLPKAAAPLCGAARSAVSSGGGISALRLVRSVRSCATLAKSVFVLKTKVLCPAAASAGFVRPKIWPRSEVGQKSQNFESSQNGLAYSGNLSGLQKSTFSQFRSPQLHFDPKSKNIHIFFTKSRQ